MLATRKRRLAQVEQRKASQQAATIRVYFHHELERCDQHKRCHVVLQTGEHIQNVTELEFRDGW